MNAHVIKGGIIVNTIVVDSLDFLPGLVDAKVGGAIGDGWDGSQVIPQAPPKPDPEKVDIETLVNALLKKSVITEKDLEN